MELEQSKMVYTASAPGSLMLFGEHAILHGKHALTCAINKRITVSLTPRSDRKIYIVSSLLGEYVTSLDEIVVTEAFSYILESIKLIQHQLTTVLNGGFNLKVDSEFSSHMGLGSSAAVIVATLAVLKHWLQGGQLDLLQLHTDAKNVIRVVQGTGSGADAAASIYGGIVKYRMSPFALEKIAGTFPIVAIYTGTKRKTKEIILLVESLRVKHVNIFSILFDVIDECVSCAVNAIKSQDWKRLGELMNIHQGIQDAIGVNNEIITSIISALRAQPNILGAKISGAGLGDCVIALGTIENDVAGKFKHKKNTITDIPLEISTQGVQVEFMNNKL